MTLQKKKILFFIATLAQGGAERLISELSFKLPDFDIVIVISENKVSYPYQGKLVVLNIPFPKNFFLKIYCYFLRFLKLRKVLQTEKPDYMVSFGAFAHVTNVVLNRDVFLHTDMFYSKARNDFWGFVLKVFARFFYNRAQKIIPVSLSSAEDLVQNYGIQRKKIQVIYNPVDIEKIQRLRKEPLGQAFQEIFSHPVVITMGRLMKQKGQQYLIKAFKKFKETVRDAKLVILGEGELEAALEKLARDLNIQDDVHFLGWQDNPFPFLRSSQFFVLSSLYEGLPTVLLEAMACGLPVVSTDCKSGPREILAPATDSNKTAKEIEIAECGILVPVEDEEILSRAMVLLAEDPSLRVSLAEKARKRAEDFSMERILGDWKLLFGYGKVGDTKL
ncbi:MAG: glycosyltransferase [Candidatus Wildermuthbacteria bacterium]|nr:glycosyltransferase [Candidatus Wildermuthbacteria bacterium]